MEVELSGGRDRIAEAAEAPEQEQMLLVKPQPTASSTPTITLPMGSNSVLDKSGRGDVLRLADASATSDAKPAAALVLDLILSKPTKDLFLRGLVMNVCNEVPYHGIQGHRTV